MGYLARTHEVSQRKGRCPPSQEGVSPYSTGGHGTSTLMLFSLTPFHLITVFSNPAHWNYGSYYLIQTKPTFTEQTSGVQDPHKEARVWKPVATANTRQEQGLSGRAETEEHELSKGVFPKPDSLSSDSWQDHILNQWPGEVTYWHDVSVSLCHIGCNMKLSSLQQWLVRQIKWEKPGIHT